MARYFLLPMLLLATGTADAQKLKKEDRLLLSNLQTHIQFLSNDGLEGRRTGTEGERKAALYLSGTFKGAGLDPKGTDGYFQPFDIPEGRQIGSATHLFIDDQELTLGKEFFPLAFSSNGSVTALSSPSLQELKSPWFLDVKELLEENGKNPHFNLTEEVRKKVLRMQDKGATAVIVYNSSKNPDNLSFDGKDKGQMAAVPVLYVKKEAVKKYLSDESATLDIKLKTDISPKSRKGTNVVGFINNGAPRTIVIGAHYDHLGLGEDGNSLHGAATPAVHNGADDNASGTAALIELAKRLKKSKLRQHNYLFIAFSGEELGLLGSKHFVENPTVDLSTINYMINLDMVGRLNEGSPTLTVGGFGTTPAWGQLYGGTGKNKLFTDNLLFRFDSSGSGPSDHTSFYNKGIPVLFYFTGLHQDYHRPTDDADRINYTGTGRIIKHVYSVIEKTDKTKEKLSFNRTKDTQFSTATAFSVTLGIMPDYSFSGSGVRVDGVGEGRPAQRAGLKPGDVITSLGDHKVTSVESYMQGLGKYKKGEKTKLTYIRNNQELSTIVEF